MSFTGERDEFCSDKLEKGGKSHLCLAIFEEMVPHKLNDLVWNEERRKNAKEFIEKYGTMFPTI